MSTVEPNDPHLVLSPLADPVIGAIFANVEVAGLASESFIKATMKAANENGLLGKIVRVTPQSSKSSPTKRGCRVDIETETDANEYVRYEVAIAPDKHIMTRDLFSASHLFVETSDKGSTSAQMAKKMPKVIYINLLGFILRKSNADMVQPFKVMYTKPPQEVAVPNFGGYNIQLPRILETEPDFDDDLYCWCCALYTAHLEKKSVKEVVTMTPGLQAFVERDAGFRQFIERYQTVSADPVTLRDYVRWVEDEMRQEGREAWARDEGLEKGLAQAAAEYEPRLAAAEQRLLESARVMKKKGFSIEDVAEVFNLSTSEIEAL